MKETRRSIEGIAITVLFAASGCGASVTASPAEPSPATSAQPDGRQVYSTIEDLRKAYDEVGQCSNPTDVRATALTCEDKTILTIAASESARDEEVAAARFYTEKLGYRVLVGGNWIISGKDIESARQKLGGIVAG